MNIMRDCVIQTWMSWELLSKPLRLSAYEFGLQDLVVKVPSLRPDSVGLQQILGLIV